ncbi:Colicin-E3 immunity protein (ImmE3) (Microcin-E3 immunity protein) (Colicin-E3 chain B) (modular protein) [Xenorhabdus nematophila ATCC 19061]|uniref:Colicin-E3 immunity protein (ImmE3) (Microcin-E3 immunity protein) (Colicin-E3 chain B) (Modular protein) n=2 Tax=Xenorhabdus nematophila TaxID=628 RepID=D3VLI6_XENNA|nr:putative hemagglutinin/hemolysin [Xenorhabdus nematophila]CBJ91312.1 Colicin-E3 immunity protein (ImmE3) (Microcin-E3 immunity protein) (Colicin-E3 chain B) (modular protein) [Xenorhabdus nematophila ATCC 19061]CEK24131.1 xenocin-immunity protein [Xenorhabdus nematophila AN6/1]
MGIQLKLTWFDKKNEDFVGKEYSQDLGYDDSIIENCGLPLDDTLNNGVFDVLDAWVPVLQGNFNHQINFDKHFYQISFDYRMTDKEKEESKRKAEEEAERKSIEEADRKAKEEGFSDLGEKMRYEIAKGVAERIAKENEKAFLDDFPRFAELEFFLNNPLIVMDIGVFKQDETNITTNAIRFSSQGRGNNQFKAKAHRSLTNGEGSQQNAFSHSLWSATIAAKHGVEVANFAGNAHEGTPSSAGARNFKHLDLNKRFVDSSDPEIEGDKIVDMLNNEIGRKIGQVSGTKSMKELSLKLLDHFYKDGLYVFDKIDYVEYMGIDSLTIGKEKITTEQYNYMRDLFHKLDENGILPEGFELGETGKIVPKK